MSRSNHKVTLTEDIDEVATSRSLQVATVALLSEAARTSDGINGDELARVMGALFREFGLTDPEGAELLEIAELLLKEPDRHDKVIAEIKEKFSPVQREHILSLVWRVIKADGIATKDETKFAADLRKSLDLTLEQALRAQQLSAPEELPKASESGE